MYFKRHYFSLLGPSSLIVPALVLTLTSITVSAEVTIDGSLGGQAGAAVLPGNGFNYDISPSYGQLAGKNLFHSFDQFNIGVGEHANFSGMPSITNIIARITGGESSIAGRITSSINNSSLFLVNPAGFIISNGAVVDVDGTFYLSTADFLEFEDDARFFSRLSPVSTLSTAPIVDFGFLEGGTGRITIESSRAIPGEDKSTGQNLNVNSEFISIEDTDIVAQEIGIRMGDAAFGEIFIGNSVLESVEGGIFFQGGNIFSVDSLITASGVGSEVQIRANSVALEGQQGESTIQSGNLTASGGGIDIEAAEISLSHNSALNSFSGGGRQGGDIELKALNILIEDQSQINLAAGPGSTSGDLFIRSNNLLIRDNSALNTSSRFLGATAGNIDIQVTNRFGLEGNSVLLAESESNGVGGQIEVLAKQIIIRDNSEISINAKGNGDSKLVDLVASENLTIDQNSIVSAVSSGTGAAGVVQLRGKNILLDDITIRGTSNGEGRGGDILIEANVVEITNSTRFNVSSLSRDANAGDAGRIDIRAGSISINDSTSFSLSTEGDGIGGILQVEAPDILFANSSINADAKGAGQGGDIIFTGANIDWQSIRIDASAQGSGLGGFIRLDGAVQISNSFINISARGLGDAGDFLSTGESFTLNGGALIGDTQGDGTGANIRISSQSVQLNNTIITSGTSLGAGQGGEILIDSSTSITIFNSELNSKSDGAGIGGDLGLRAPNLVISGDSMLNVSATGSADAGDIGITAENLTFSNNAIVLISANGSGQAGRFNASTNNFILQDRSEIQASVDLNSVGDLILINTQNFTIKDSAKISSNTFGNGEGGVIDINAETVNLLGSSSLEAAALGGTGDAGLISIAGRGIDTSARTVLLDGGRIITNSVSAGRGGGVLIDTADLTIVNGAAIRSDSLAQGDGGGFLIRASNLTLDNSDLTAEVRGSGHGGEINLLVNNVSLINGASINVSSLTGSGDAGTINISSVDISVVDSKIALATATAGDAGILTINTTNLNLDNSSIRGRTTGTGVGSDIIINAENARFTNGSFIDSATRDSGQGGIIILTGNTLSIENSRLNAETSGSADGGSIELQFKDISITGKSDLNVKSSRPRIDDPFSSNQEIGNAGNIAITANNYNMDGGLILLVTETRGAGGTLTINADNIALTNNAVITASALGNGDAGIVTLQGIGSTDQLSIPSSTVSLTGSSVINSDTQGDGIGGDIFINTARLDLIEASLISSSATGLADGGSITIFADDSLEIVGATIQTVSERSGGGNITIQTQDVIRIDNGTVSASANGVKTDSDGGNITIDPQLFTVRQSQIIAQANVGNGGNINLSADNFIVDTESLISASSQKGIDGSVEIESPNQQVNPVNMDLNTGFQDLPDFISDNCSEVTLKDRSYLVVESLNSVKRDPNDYLPVFRKSNSGNGVGRNGVGRNGMDRNGAGTNSLAQRKVQNMRGC